MRNLLMIGIVLGCTLLACGGGEDPGNDLTGSWVGELEVAGMTLELKAEFQETGEGLTGTLDIPQQQAWGLELIDIAVNGDSILFSLPSNLGRGDFRGVISADSLVGSYEQSGMTGSFMLLRSDEAPESTGEEVTITGEDCILAGTLVLPDGDQPFPCVILLSGSGLQDRDEHVMGFPVFGRLSEIIQETGLAVLRCDDRGIGGSSGGLENFSDSVLVYEAGLMLDHLLMDSRIDPDVIEILGHSEGSNTAFMLAAQRPDDVAFVISMAGPAVSGYDLIPSQLEVMLAMQGYSQDDIDEKLQAQYFIMDAVIAGDSAGVDSVLRAQTVAELEKLDEQQLAALGDFDQFVQQSVSSGVESVWTPWFRNFLMHDPARAAENVEVPVLSLFGGLDTQVIPDLNAERMLSALEGNEDHSVIVLANANHLFQEAVTGSVSEYATLEPAFIEGFEDTLTAWLSHRFVR